MGNPFAVIWRISLVVVYSINLLFSDAQFSERFIKPGEGVPLSANFNSSGSVVFKIWVFVVVAALNYVCPKLVNIRIGHPMPNLGSKFFIGARMHLRPLSNDYPRAQIHRP